jgi:hypothetical protein
MNAVLVEQSLLLRYPTDAAVGGFLTDHAAVDIERSILLHLVDRAKESGLSLF